MPGSGHPSRLGKRALGVVLAASALLVAGVTGPGGSPVASPRAEALGTTPGDASNPEIVMNDDGDAIAVWYRTVDAMYQVEARYRPAGGAWGQPKLLSGASPTTAPPHVAIDPAGNAAAIWLRQVNGVNVVQAARRSASGTWGPAKTLSPKGVNAFSSDIVMDGDGDITAAWTTLVFGGDDQLQVADRPKGGSWSAVDILSPAGEDAGAPSLTTTPGGTTMVAWISSPTSRVKTIRRPAGGDWGAVVPVSAAGTTADFVDLAMDAQARAVVVWRGPVNATSAMQARRRTSQGWGPIQVLSPAGSQASSPGNVAMSAGGDAYVSWAGVNNGRNRAMVVRRPVSGGWGPVVKLSAVGQSADAARVAVNSRGDAVAMWNRFFDGSNWVEASYRPVGGDWGLATEVSEPGRSSSAPKVALGNDRTALGVFSAFENTIFRLQTVTRSPSGSWSDPVFLSPLP